MAETSGLPPILQTKLFRPPLSEDHVHRSRLLEWLKQSKRYPLTVVSAPAGYGKSVLLSCFFEQCECHSAWLSLDKNDNDLGLFKNYFLAALQSAIPSFGDELTDLLEGTGVPPTPVFVQLLLDELDQLESDILVIIDDYGFINNDDIHEFITDLMRHPHPRLHLVLGTRYDPQLPLTEWRARDQLVEIRSIDLRFSLDETRTFLQRVIDVPLKEDTIISVHARTEGWITGLRLATLSFSHIETFRGQIDEISGSNMYVSDYLFSQVLTKLTAETQLFLFHSSILNRVSASLGQAVAMPDSSPEEVQALLQDLVAANVFTIPLDQSRQWFRYHHLFQDFLMTNLRENNSPEIVASLHRQASAWYAEHDYIEEALRHSFRANDVETALELVGENRHELIDQESYQRLTRWLKMFSQEVIEESPDLLLIQARFAQTTRLDIGELYQLTEMVEALLKRLHLEPQKAQLLAAENEALRSAAFFYIAPDPQVSLTCCRNALDVLPQHWFTMRSYCWMFGAVALQMTGDLNGAYEWIAQGRHEDQTARGGPFARNVAAEGFVSWVAGNLTGLQHVGELMIGITSKSGYWETRGWGNHFLASVHYHRNNLERALNHAQQTFNHRHYHPSANVDSAFILTLIQQALGKPKEARAMLKIAMDFAVEMQSPSFTYLVQSFQAELAVMQGRGREYIQWAEQAYAQLQLAPMVYFYAPPLTIPKVLLAAGTPAGRTMAADCLQHLHEYAESKYHTRVMIEVLALQALLHTANNDEEAALVALEESLGLAQPGGFIRLYVDLGPEMAELLRRLHNRKPFVEYTTSILKAFADASNSVSLSKVDEQLIEPLTDREAEILDLLAKRYSNKEIAAELFILPTTVKRYAINLYQKLNVHNRRQAVEAARALGLIPPD